MDRVITAKMIAEYFLTKDAMTQKKIQKLVYYAYVWYIVDNNDTNNISNVLFNEKPQAWVHGPVFPSLYEEYRNFGRENIPKLDSITIKLNENIKKFLDEIWGIFGRYDGDELEILTHKEEPWIKARRGIAATAPSNEKITDTDIYNYYSMLEA